MTNDEMGQKIIAALGKPMGFHSSKAGSFLKIDGEDFEVTEQQACILWDLLPQIAGYKAPPVAQPEGK